MNDASVTRVLILAEPATSRVWEESLRRPQMEVWIGREKISEGEHPEIILTDSGTLPSAVRDEVGVVSVGGSGPADVYLASDCTGDELFRTCRLLGEIVRLRRQEREAARRHRELTAAALTDVLTELPNRRAWDIKLSQRILNCTVMKRLCLAVLDIDKFKTVNDTFGHAAGDQLLRKASRAMQQSVRQDDFVARLGGDEFGILLWLPLDACVAPIVERVRGQIATAIGDVDHMNFTASAGYALSQGRPGTDTAESLFEAADTALLAAKRAGGDRTFAAIQSLDTSRLGPHPPAAMEEPKNRAEQDRVQN